MGFGSIQSGKEGRRAASEADVKGHGESSDADKDNLEKDTLLRQVDVLIKLQYRCNGAYHVISLAHQFIYFSRKFTFQTILCIIELKLTFFWPLLIWLLIKTCFKGMLTLFS